MNGLSVVVVTWNCAAFIKRFVSELEASLRPIDTYEVLILDNRSTDTTPEILERCIPERFQLVRSVENLGFAGGNNVLLRMARFEQIVLLNPDVFDYPQGFWGLVIAARAREKADVAFIRLLNADGSFQDCVGDSPTLGRAFTSLLGRRKDWSQVMEPTRVQVGIMAFLITTKKVFDEVGLIDEGFHMYSEDVEWCWRATKAGKKLMFLPEFSLTHLGGASASKRWNETAKRGVKLRSELLFIKKSYKGWMRYSAMAIIGIKLGLNEVARLACKLRKAG